MNNKKLLKTVLLNELLSSSSSDEEDDIIDYLKVKPINPEKKRIEDYIKNVVENYTDDEFRENFRLSRTAVINLIDMFEVSPFYPCTAPFTPKSPTVHILAFLWYAVNKSTLRSVSERFNMSRSTLLVTNDRVMDFLLSIGPRIICFPTSQEEKEHAAAEFEEIAGFPGVVGAIDGTYINLRAPAHKIKSTYINRHDSPSLTLQAVCDKNLKFLDCFTGISSKIHDSRVFKLSFIKPLVHQLGDQFHLVGDAAYGISKNVMTPYKDYGNLNRNEVRYNYKHSATRVKVENSFSLLKARFRNLVRTDFMTVEKTAKFIMCCCVLHNIAVESDDFLFDLPELDEIRNFDTGDFDAVNFDHRADRAAGNRKRANIVQNMQ